MEVNGREHRTVESLRAEQSTAVLSTPVLSMLLLTAVLVISFLVLNALQSLRSGDYRKQNPLRRSSPTLQATLSLQHPWALLYSLTPALMLFAITMTKEKRVATKSQHARTQLCSNRGNFGRLQDSPMQAGPVLRRQLPEDPAQNWRKCHPQGS